MATGKLITERSCLAITPFFRPEQQPPTDSEKKRMGNNFFILIEQVKIETRTIIHRIFILNCEIGTEFHKGC